VLDTVMKRLASASYGTPVEKGNSAD
jgi:hypothetical protein